MSKLASQKNTALEHITACQEMLGKLMKREAEKPVLAHADLYLRWLGEGLAGAKAEISPINVVAVESLWRTHQPTFKALEKYTVAAENEFRKETSGVFACLDQIAVSYLAEFQQDSISDIEQIRRRSQVTLRVLYFMPRRRLAFLLSWRFAVVVIMLGLLAGTTAYITTYQQKGSSPIQTTKSAISRDVAEVKKTAEESHESKLEKGLKTTTAAIKQLPALSKDLLALFAAIAAALRLVRPTVGPSVRKAKRN